jgi:hypothetical protein
MRKDVYGFAIGAFVAVACLGASMALHNNGLEFPDGSFQSTAAVLPAATAVQITGSVNILEFDYCVLPQSLYTVPTGKRLAIEWISVEIHADIAADPVDVNITTWDGSSQINHPLVRMPDMELLSGNIFYTQRWHSPILLYSETGQDVQLFACRSGDPNAIQTVEVTASGHLVDVV